MATFKDSTGREWVVVVDLPAMRRVRARTGFELGKQSRLRELADDWVLLVDVLYVLCEEQAKSAGVQPEEFGKALVGDPIGEALDAFQDAYLDFYPSRQAEPLRALLAMTRDMEAAAQRSVLEIASTTSSGTPGSSPESAESTPCPAG